MKKIDETALNKAGNVTNLLIQRLGKTSFQIEVPDLTHSLPRTDLGMLVVPSNLQIRYMNRGRGASKFNDFILTGSSSFL